jgi:Domain of unknown function (DUF6881)
MLEYIRVLWKHSHPDEPIELRYEVLPDRSVPRMVEIFANGRMEANTLDWERRHSRFQACSLVGGQMQTAAELRERTRTDSPGQFEVFEITQHEFETAFQDATPLCGEKP